MTKFQTFISNNVLRIEYQCQVHPRIQIIPLKYITSVECQNQRPPCVIIQFNTLHKYNRAEIDYSSHSVAEEAFNEIQKGLEHVHSDPTKLS